MKNQMQCKKRLSLKTTNVVKYECIKTLKMACYKPNSFSIFSANWKGVYTSLLTFFYLNRRKYWFRANFRFPVFDGFVRFGISWTRLDYFWKMSACLSMCVWQNLFRKCSSRTNQQNLMKFCISCCPNKNWCLSAFG